MIEEPDCPHYVVTAGVGDEVSECLAGYVARSRFRPVRFLVCVLQVNYTFTVAEKGKALPGEVNGFSRSPELLKEVGYHSCRPRSARTRPYRRCQSPAETNRLGQP
jgi:hypothetical protein